VSTCPSTPDLCADLTHSSAHSAACYGAGSSTKIGIFRVVLVWYSAYGG
jgi:hypothetical protein